MKWFGWLKGWFLAQKWFWDIYYTLLKVIVVFVVFLGILGVVWLIGFNTTNKWFGLSMGALLWILCIISGLKKTAQIFFLFLLGVVLWAWLSSFPLSINKTIACVVGGLTTLFFVYYSIRKIPNDPPHRGLLVVWGERKPKIIKEGWTFLPLYPFVFDVVLVQITKIDQDLAEQTVRTPDLAELSVAVSITWTPDADYTFPQNLINFLNSGGEEGVKNILTDIVQDRMRSWAISKNEGPANWQEAMAAREEAIAIILKAIVGDALSHIPFFPTPVALKYYNNPRVSPSEYERRRWGKNWEIFERERDALSPTDKQEFEERVKERQGDVRHAREGNCFFKIPNLGIVINRFTVDEMKVRGVVAEAAERKTAQIHQQAADKVAVDNVQRRVRSLQKNLGLTPEAALHVVLLERGKTTQAIDVKRLEVSDETRQLLKDLGLAYVAKL